MNSLIIAFVVGGLFCVAAQLLMDFTKLTPAYIMVLFVSLGAILSALGIYGPLVEWAGAGASVPITNFGHLLTQGVFQGIEEQGAFGALTGLYSLSSAGIGSALLCGVAAAVVARPKG